MMTFRVRYFDGAVTYVAARTLFQATLTAHVLKPAQGFAVREATDEELAALLAAHSLDLGVDEEEEEEEEEA